MTEHPIQAAEKDLPFSDQKNICMLEQQPALALRSGMVCPECGLALLDYDGMLNLSCPSCAFTGGGGGSYT